jgi:uncharacterized protein YukJ
MPIENYGVLKGRITECRQERDNVAPHYHIRVRSAGMDVRVSINVQSNDRSRPDLLHCIDDDFRHPLMEQLAALDDGWHEGVPGPDGLAVDYVRGGMVTREQMQAIAHDVPGADNDLNDRLDALIRKACDDPEVEVYAFGSSWGPERFERDDVFRFLPGRGVHDVHMNQGTPRFDRHSHDNGTWQDGAVFLHLRRERRWVAIFLAFQSQRWQTDAAGFPGSESPARPGATHAGGPAPAPKTGRRRPRAGEGVRILTADVNPAGDDRGLETVTLHNTSSAVVRLDGWQLDNGEGAHLALTGELAPDARLVVTLPPEVPLSNRGGAILLLDAAGKEADGVTYTRDQARQEGRTVRFQG